MMKGSQGNSLRQCFFVTVGALLCGFLTLAATPLEQAKENQEDIGILRYLYEWGEPGTGTGQFRALRGIASYDRPESDGRTLIVLADGGRDLLRAYTWNMMFIDKWGSGGSEPGEFYEPRGVAVGTDGHLWVVDSRNHRIQKTVIGTKTFLDRPGETLLFFGSRGKEPGQFDTPTGIGVGPDGSVYIVDTENHRIQKFDAQGNFLAAWGSLGKGENQLDRPTYIAFDSQGRAYVSDTGNHRIQVFDQNGEFLKSIGKIGSHLGHFAEPKGLAIDGKDNLWVIDRRNHRVQKFNPEGGVVGALGRQGADRGEFSFPEDITIDSSGRVYVTDGMNGRIQVFKPI